MQGGAGEAFKLQTLQNAWVGECKNVLVSGALELLISLIPQKSPSTTLRLAGEANLRTTKSPATTAQSQGKNELIVLQVLWHAFISEASVNHSFFTAW